MLHYLWLQYAISGGLWAALIQAGSFDAILNNRDAASAALTAVRPQMGRVRGDSSSKAVHGGIEFISVPFHMRQRKEHHRIVGVGGHGSKAVCPGLVVQSDMSQNDTAPQMRMAVARGAGAASILFTSAMVEPALWKQCAQCTQRSPFPTLFLDLLSAYQED